MARDYFMAPVHFMEQGTPGGVSGNSCPIEVDSCHRHDSLDKRREARGAASDHKCGEHPSRPHVGTVSASRPSHDVR